MYYGGISNGCKRRCDRDDDQKKHERAALVDHRRAGTDGVLRCPLHHRGGDSKIKHNAKIPARQRWAGPAESGKRQPSGKTRNNADQHTHMTRDIAEEFTSLPADPIMHREISMPQIALPCGLEPSQTRIIPLQAKVHSLQFLICRSSFLMTAVNISRSACRIFANSSEETPEGL